MECRPKGNKMVKSVNEVFLFPGGILLSNFTNIHNAFVLPVSDSEATHPSFKKIKSQKLNYLMQSPH